MATKTIYFDESGFTGGDLLNPDQPIFCVASSDVQDAEADAILRASFPRYQGVEFKFTNIWPRLTNRQGLLKIAENIASDPSRYFSYWIDKKFCTLTKFVDYFIEPVLHDAGFDFYADKYAPKFCNRFKFGLDHFCPPELYESTVAHYHSFTRNPTEDTLSQLIAVLRVMATSSPEEVRDYYGMATAGAERFRIYNTPEAHKTSNELQLTTVLSSIAYWRSISDDDFEIVHDQSSNFFKQEDIWIAITSSDVPEQVHSLGSGFNLKFPLRINSTTSVDSKISRGVQLCDVVAGLVAKSKRPGNTVDEQSFLNDVVSAGLGELMVDSIGAGLDLATGPPSRLSGPDAVDRMRNVIFGSRRPTNS